MPDYSSRGNPTQHDGATIAEWTHWADTLGMAEDLLPVVCRADAVISPQSSIKSLGKIPTIYNSKGEVCGIKEWTTKRATPEQCLAWSKNPDFGICIQTRNTRAIDIDVPDVEAARVIVETIDTLLGLALPKRYRQKTGKCLLIVGVPGEIPKNVIKVRGGILEFLGNGEQFVAHGQHFNKTGPSGTRYEWEGGLPQEIPKIEIEQYWELQEALLMLFGVEDVVLKVKHTTRSTSENITVKDNIADWLIAQSLVLQYHKDAFDIMCPWSDLHSSESTDTTSTQYFLAGTRGHETGGFKCLHAHCSNRKSQDFMDVLGYSSTGFDPVIPMGITTVDTLSIQPKQPNFNRDSKGQIDSTLHNICLALEHPDWLGMGVYHDDFLGELCYSDAHGAITRFTDASYTLLRKNLESKLFKKVSSEIMRDCVLLHTTNNRIDTAINWLKELTWDGVPRISTFFNTYLPCASACTEYPQAVARYLWSALAGRVLTPGVKADMVPVLVSKQGTCKTTTLEALTPEKGRYISINLADKDADLARMMRGKIICELGELRGFSARDWLGINDFITRRTDEWVPKFKEFSDAYARRSVFIGTCNTVAMLSDPTGSRRWLPLVMSANSNLDAITRDRDQLWAEAAVLYQTEGICFAEAEHLASDVHRRHTTIDPWAEVLRAYLSSVKKDGYTLQSLAENALGITTKDLTPKLHVRVDNVLKGLGMQYGTEAGMWILINE